MTGQHYPTQVQTPQQAYNYNYNNYKYKYNNYNNYNNYTHDHQQQYINKATITSISETNLKTQWKVDYNVNAHMINNEEDL